MESVKWNTDHTDFHGKIYPCPSAQSVFGNKNYLCLSVKSVFHKKTLQCSSIPLHHARKSHERHGKDAGGDEGDRRTFHALRGFHQLDVLTDAREDDQRQGET